MNEIINLEIEVEGDDFIVVFVVVILVYLFFKKRYFVYVNIMFFVFSFFR